MGTLFRSPSCQILGVEKAKGFKLPNDLYYNIFIKIHRPEKDKDMDDDEAQKEEKKDKDMDDDEARKEEKKDKDMDNDEAQKEEKKDKDMDYDEARKEEKKEKFEPQVGDLFALSDIKPRCIADLNRPKIPYTLVVVKSYEDDKLQIISSKPIYFFNKEKDCNEEKAMGKRRDTLFAVCLTNLTTNIRIWNAIHPDPVAGNFSIIREVLQGKQSVEQNCTICSTDTKVSANVLKSKKAVSNFGLDSSQEDSILSCVSTRECHHRITVKLIWGPPGTGKTKTVASLLFALLKMKCRTLTCAPTNIAVVGVTKRLMKLVTLNPQHQTYGFGDIVLFGNEERMAIDDHEDLYDIFLYYRISELASCLFPSSGWKSSLEFLISLLEEPNEHYIRYKERMEAEIACNNDRNDEASDNKEDGKRKGNCSRDNKGKGKKRTPRNIILQTVKENKSNKKKGVVTDPKAEVKDIEIMTIEEFVRKEFHKFSDQLISCMTILYTHLPSRFIRMEIVKEMIRLIDMLRSLRELLDNDSVSQGSIESCVETVCDRKGAVLLCKHCETKEGCLSILRLLRETFSLPDFSCGMKQFCLQNATLIFCTASSSAKLNVEGSASIEMVIIDEAAQLKECESCIPLQLNGLRHAVLIGDEKQLPAMVQSKICENAGFGRSLFERLVILGHPRHLLKIQYRMHPSISLFPRKQFYDDQIMDGPNVKGKSHDRRFLSGNIFGTYSFIDVPNGIESFGDKGSKKNMAEVFVVDEIVARLSKVSTSTNQKIRVGCISPYKAQAFAIQEKLGKKYSTDVDSIFSVNVRSVDGFQGGEEDVIIISTVRCNGNGSVGFLSNFQRTNVALTRARHCLLILGSGATLTNSGTIWKKIVIDAKSRGCFHCASSDEMLNQAIYESFIEHGQIEALFRSGSPLFKEAKWKVIFDNKFLNSLKVLNNAEINKKVLSVLKKLSSGWRQARHETIPKDDEGISNQLMEIYNVKGILKLIWTVDIHMESSKHIQVLKIWDILPSPKIPELAKRLEILFGDYTMNVITRCKDQHVDRNLVLPKTWPVEITRAANTSFSGKDDETESLSSQLAGIRLADEVSMNSRRQHHGQGTSWWKRAT